MGERTSQESVIRDSAHSYKSDLYDVWVRHDELMGQHRSLEEQVSLELAAHLSELEEAKEKVALAGREKS